MLSLFLFANSEHVVTPQLKMTWSAKSFWAESIILPSPGFAERGGYWRAMRIQAGIFELSASCP